ncbi:MAG TPA: tetratricopeptide repeat protein [Gemmatimonadaceae bacterium]
MITLGERRDAFLETIARLTAERAAARGIVSSLRASSAEVWDWEIPAHWRTAGFVQELTSTASDALESNPRESLAYAQLALAIATSIPVGTYPTPVQAQIEGAAWKEIGTAHRYVGEFDAALRAYDAAQRAYGEADTLVHDSAVIELARAIVLPEMQRHEEALQLLASIEPVFESFEDRRHLVQVRQLTANIFYMQSRMQEARTVLEKALQDVSFDDLYTRAGLTSTLGLIYGQLGRREEALALFHRARGMFVDLGMTGEVTRTDWAVATTVLELGDTTKAIELLRSSRTNFLRLTMAHEAGLAGLDLADALIVDGRMSEARQVVESALAEFIAAKLNHNAIIALAYLRDILPTTSSPRKAVDHVKKHLKRLSFEPARVFLPQPEE